MPATTGFLRLWAMRLKSWEFAAADAGRVKEPIVLSTIVVNFPKSANSEQLGFDYSS